MNRELTNAISTGIQHFFRKHGSTTLAFLGATGVIGTAVLSAVATPKAVKCIERAKEEKGEELTTMEKVKVVAPVYIPTALLGVSTITCIFGSTALSKRSQASMASAYALLNQGYTEYRKKVNELYGEDADKKVRDAIALQKCEVVDRDYVNWCSDAISLDEITDENEYCLFYEEISGRYFESTLLKVQSAEYHFNRNFTMFGAACVNDYYQCLGLAAIEGGDSIGWNISDGVYWMDFDHRKVAINDDLQVNLIRPHQFAYAISPIWSPSVDFDEC